MPQVMYALQMHDGTSTAAPALTPRAGSAHADAFRITTSPVGHVWVTAPGGVGGAWRNYMSAPKGRAGKLDLLSRHTDTGELSVDVLDHRTGSSNLVRWATAYLGDAGGANRLIGNAVQIWESLTGGNSWLPYFVGRVVHVEAPDPRTGGPVLRLVLKDVRVEEYRTVFTGAPHHSVAYARPSPLAPVGPVSLTTEGWRWMGSEALWYPPGRARVRNLGSTNGNAGASLISFNSDQGDLDITGSNRRRFVVERLKLTAALAESCDLRDTTSEHATAAGRPVCPHVRARVQLVGGWGGPLPINAGAWGDFYVTPVLTGQAWSYSSFGGGGSGRAFGFGYDGEATSPLRLHNDQEDRPGRVESVALAALAPGHPRYMSQSSLVVDQRLCAYLYRYGPPTTEAPILINPVHPARLWMDLCDGKFGELGVNGEVLRTLIPYDADRMAWALLQDLPKVRFLITKPWDMQEFLERALFQVVHLGSRTTADGKVYPVDLRLPAAIPAGAPWGPSEVVKAEWEQGSDLVTNVEVRAVTHGFADEVDLILKTEEIPVAVPACGLLTREFGQAFLSPRANLLPLQKHEVRAEGLDADYLVMPSILQGNAAAGMWYERSLRTKFAQGPMQAVAGEYLDRFGTGAAYLRVTARRNATTEATQVGDWVLVDVPSTPNAASNQRGGIRAMQCLERKNEPNGQLTFRFVDGGPSTLTVAPTLGALSLAAGMATEAVQFTLTQPAAMVSPVTRVWYAAMDPATPAAPATGAADWIRVGETTASGAQVIRDLPAGSRVWVMAQSSAVGRLPSPRVVQGPVTTSPLPPVAGFYVAAAFNTARLTWTPDPTWQLEVYVAMGSANALDDAHRVAVVPSADGVYELRGLNLNATHTVTVRHRDGRGGFGEHTGWTFTTGATAPPAPRPAGLAVSQGVL